MRKHNAAIVCADSSKYPQFADQTADFAYARLMRSREEIETGYTEGEIDGWTDTARAWREGKQPGGLTYASDTKPKPGKNRDAYMFFISGAKVRAPAAAEAMIARLD